MVPSHEFNMKFVQICPVQIVKSMVVAFQEKHSIKILEYLRFQECKMNSTIAGVLDFCQLLRGIELWMQASNDRSRITTSEFVNCISGRKK